MRGIRACSPALLRRGKATAKRTTGRQRRASVSLRPFHRPNAGHHQPRAGLSPARLQRRAISASRRRPRWRRSCPTRPTGPSWSWRSTPASAGASSSGPQSRRSRAVVGVVGTTPPVFMFFWSCSGKAEATVHAVAIRPSFRPAISPARLPARRSSVTSRRPGWSPPLRDEIFIRFLASEREGRTAVLEQLARQEEEYRRYLSLVHEEAERPNRTVTRRLAHEAALGHAEAHLRWLARCRELFSSEEPVRNAS